MKKLVFTLKEMLEKREITQRQFVEMSGIRYQTVSRMCTNHIELTYVKNEHIEICCELLKCDLADLMKIIDVPGEREYKQIVLPKYNNTGRRRIY